MHDPLWDLFTIVVDDRGAHFTFARRELMVRWLQVLKQYTGYPEQNHMGGLLTCRTASSLGISRDGLECLLDAVRQNPGRVLGEYWRLAERFEHVFSECYDGRHPKGPKTIWERLIA